MVPNCATNHILAQSSISIPIGNVRKLGFLNAFIGIEMKRWYKVGQGEEIFLHY